MFVLFIWRYVKRLKVIVIIKKIILVFKNIEYE